MRAATNLAGKNVLLAGAAGRLGAELARQLCAAGAHVLLVAPQQHELDRLRSELVTRGGCAAAACADLADLDQCARVVRAAGEQLGHVDVLIQNAVAHGSPPSRAQRLKLDLTTPIALTRAVLPAMLRARAGHIVHIASLAGPLPHDTVRAAAKAGLAAFSCALRLELEGTGVRVSMVRASAMPRAERWGETPGQRAAQTVLGVLADDRPMVQARPCPRPAFTPSPTTPSAATTPWPSRASSAGAS
jgi:short-subunit dehydrogenase